MIGSFIAPVSVGCDHRQAHMRRATAPKPSWSEKFLDGAIGRGRYDLRRAHLSSLASTAGTRDRALQPIATPTGAPRIAWFGIVSAAPAPFAVDHGSYIRQCNRIELARQPGLRASGQDNRMSLR